MGTEVHKFKNLLARKREICQKKMVSFGSKGWAQKYISAEFYLHEITVVPAGGGKRFMKGLNKPKQSGKTQFAAGMQVVSRQELSKKG